MAKTDLEKSHSKVSNAKLTLICVLASICFAAIWIGLALIKEHRTYGIILIAFGGVGTVLTYLLLNAFKR